jgi:hypothetical protein
MNQGLFGHPYVQRNWELQFLGDENAKQLEQYLYNENFNQWIPRALIETVYQDFKVADTVASSHAVSMLLTLSLWHQHSKSSV